ncbi:MAG: 2-amino-4-hydroxy-6-hydroxymethyldihydropteridine diphosphokinase [Phycisphaerae bacterium]
MSIIACIGLGSNLQDRRANIDGALAQIDRAPGITLLKVSQYHTTAPVGGPVGQPHFLNAAALLDTSLDARRLLSVLLAIEHALGRDRRRELRHGPRLIDLDILLYGNAIVNEPGLRIPHPHLHERAFALAPLAELAPDMLHPELHQTITYLLANLPPGKMP